MFFELLFIFSRNYKQAYANLMEVRASDANMLEIKTVAGFINYKVILVILFFNITTAHSCLKTLCHFTFDWHVDYLNCQKLGTLF